MDAIANTRSRLTVERERSASHLKVQDFPWARPRSSRGPRLPRRRRCTQPLSARRPRHEHRSSRRLQPRVEARSRCQRPGNRVRPRELRARKVPDLAQAHQDGGRDEAHFRDAAAQSGCARDSLAMDIARRSGELVPEPHPQSHSAQSLHVSPHLRQRRPRRKLQGWGPAQKLGGGCDARVWDWFPPARAVRRALRRRDGGRFPATPHRAGRARARARQIHRERLLDVSLRSGGGLSAAAVQGSRARGGGARRACREELVRPPAAPRREPARRVCQSRRRCRAVLHRRARAARSPRHALRRHSGRAPAPARRGRMRLRRPHGRGPSAVQRARSWQRARGCRRDPPRWPHPLHRARPRAIAARAQKLASHHSRRKMKGTL
mmetsp:Transcript_8045/g.26732  ORF Transcript_8045/g.26732 Transcript_8045/m.26732 type:complete len:379 (+) Transcript_8045:1118-2254(+)